MQQAKVSRGRLLVVFELMLCVLFYFNPFKIRAFFSPLRIESNSYLYLINSLETACYKDYLREARE